MMHLIRSLSSSSHNSVCVGEREGVRACGCGCEGGGGCEVAQSVPVLRASEEHAR